MKRILANNKYKFVGIVVLIAAILFYKIADSVNAAQNSFNETYDIYLRKVKTIPVLKKNRISVNSKLNFDINNLSAKSVYIEDVDTGTILFKKNPDRLLLPASTTKIMTALVVRDIYNLEDKISVKDDSWTGDNQLGFFNNEEFLVRDLLQAALIQSNNEAAYILANSTNGGIDKFVKLMNQKAKKLNLHSSYFANPVGFDDKNQRSSARDLAILSKELMKDDFLRKVVATKEKLIHDLSGTHEYYLHSTHHLLGVDKSVVGIKTGTTQGANQVLITQFNHDDKNILIIVMGSNDRYKETLQLRDWVFNNYVWLTPKQIIKQN